MKTLIKATIIALLAIISTSCDFESTYDEDDAYYLFNGKTWSRIEERPHSYYYFVCYEFHNDGTYTYWFYDVDEFLDGLSDHNSYSVIEDYKRTIDELYHY